MLAVDDGGFSASADAPTDVTPRLLLLGVLEQVVRRAVLDEMTLSLHEVLDWKVGSRILLNASADGVIELRCGEVPMFHGRMGRKGGNIAVRIEKELPKQEIAH